MSRQDPMLRIRLPEELKVWIEEEATRERRSQNGQIVWMLEKVRHSVSEPAVGQEA